MKIEIDKSNFWDISEILHSCKVNTPKESPTVITPDGSKLWIYDDHFIREANYWGYLKSCVWIIDSDNIPYKKDEDLTDSQKDWKKESLCNNIFENSVCHKIYYSDMECRMPHLYTYIKELSDFNKLCDNISKVSTTEITEALFLRGIYCSKLLDKDDIERVFVINDSQNVKIKIAINDYGYEPYIESIFKKRNHIITEISRHTGIETLQISRLKIKLELLDRVIGIFIKLLTQQ